MTKNDRKGSFLVAEVLRFGRFTETRVAGEPLLQLRELSRLQVEFTLFFGCTQGVQPGLRELSRLRVEFTQTVGDIKRRILGILDRIFPEFPGCFGNVFGRAAIQFLKTYPDPEELADADLSELAALLKESSQGRLSLDKARELKERAANSFGIRYGLDALVLELRLLLEQLEFIMGQVKQLDEAITGLMQEHQLILSVPGVGPILGAAILGEIGDIGRFENAKKLRAYAGLDATVYQSGIFEGSRARVSKRGSPYLRRALWLAAGTARLHDPVLKSYYERLITRGKHPKHAQAAVASKLCGIIFAVLSKNQPYDPDHLMKTFKETS